MHREPSKIILRPSLKQQPTTQFAVKVAPDKTHFCIIAYRSQREQSDFQCEQRLLVEFSCCLNYSYINFKGFFKMLLKSPCPGASFIIL